VRPQPLWGRYGDAMYPASRILRVDDRELAVEDSGPGDGFPILVHGGSGSRHQFPGAVRDAKQAGFRLIGYDRPGLGLSRAMPGRCVADSAADVQAIVDELGLARVAVWGASGGGPYALATAALLDDVVSAICLFAPIGPYGTPALDFTAGMEPGQEFLDEIALLLTNSSAARERFRSQAAAMLDGQGSSDWWFARWGERAGTDAAHPREWADHLAACAVDGFGTDGEGWWEDWYATFQPWGFDVRRTKAPVSLWHGLADAAVPAGHSNWYASQLPQMTLHLVADGDHTNIEEDCRSDAIDWVREQVTPT
jgi:pimeloyl-ACP methyl ester carboxylesterase